ncbi:putative RNA recognition motif domain, nucleotide-binding alpha-beta plait domain superfamily [Helianthus annuus]|uniref:RNA recognition motif domain, nucleotide-binding alpha-beta plait domain superfamily n=1 Tax=Helianthus annuus TaxID=4232 RepID=A0A9K3NDF3_HELAN|nr:nuclear speckle RNA-binding protein A isoform X1 [Helianthus annuus]KAF5795458.1 putative RNA recognition motif domain, nucleotide-binding alpha-beta plait domain superfamily [Helianthus annuus]KAJ0538955.1 putative RNA recognition motif domain, nucleotide-binding alpha-beta plait domain superfamily [Helianthus annuus]KAJ0719260.1 putative RNA recognition motif domain, nucleotide-binding alpha-beta plait domain superfamily [Helianthus annuus]KAJ0722496.1 putative RNA recognition motif domain
MGDSYWKYGAAEGRQQQQQQQPPLIGKRPRSDFDGPGGRDMPGYAARQDARGTPLVVKDSDTIGASYDRYLRGTQQLPPYSGGAESARLMGPGLGVGYQEDPRLMGLGLLGSMDSAAPNVRELGLLGVRPELSLPPDASNTLFVEGLPSDCSRREVAHIFRPFVGYREVRLVTKESRHSSGDPLVLCFVDFESPAEAATAKDALQGYKFDEHDRDSVSLRMQFARHPGARTGGAAKSGGGGMRGRR